MTPVEMIIKLLNSGKKKDSPEIQSLLESVKAADKSAYDTILVVVNNWQQPKNPLGFLGDKSVMVPGGIGLAGLVSLPYLQPFLVWLQKNVTLPAVQSPIPLLLWVAGLGGVSGFVYSVYRSRGIVLPQADDHDGVLTLTRYGFLNELVFGALAAVTTIWLAAVGIATPEPFGDGIAEAALVTETLAKLPQTGSLLTWSVVLGSLMSGWYGARMRSARLDQALLTDALARTAELDKQSPEVAAKILGAPNAAMAATEATGMAVVGASPATNSSAPSLTQ